jgi:hypothetical protein
MADQSGFVTLDDLGYPTAPAEPVQAATPAISTSAPAPAAPVAAPAAGFTMQDLGFAQDRPEQPKVSVPEDILRTSAAQGTKGVLTDVGGLPGAAQYYTQQAIQKLVSPETKAAQVEGLSPEQRFDIEEGKAVPFPGSLSAFSGTIDPRISTQPVGTLPTMSGGEEIVSREIPYTQWEAQNRISDIIGSGVRAATSTAAMGVPGGALPAAVAGAAGRAAGQIAERVSGSPMLGSGAEISTNIIADALSRKFGKIASDLAMPNSAAMEKLAQSISAGISADPERKRVLLDAINRGDPININDFIDPKTRSWLAANLPKDYAQQVLDFDAKLLNRQAEIDNQTKDTFQQIFGEDLSDSGWQQALAKTQGAETERLYQAVRANPDADYVWNSNLDKLVNQGGAVQQAAIEVSNLAKKGDFGDLNVSPINFLKDKKTNTYTVAMSSQPNFDFWDQVKRNLDAKASQAYNAGDNFNGNIYKTAAQRVRDNVSKIVGEYPEARAAGQAQITTPTALEDGYNFARTLTAKSPNLEKIDDFLTKFDRSTGEQQLRIQQGVGRSLLQLGEAGDFNQISRLMSTPGSRKALQKILGPQAFDSVYGEIARNSLMKTQSGLAQAAQSVFQGNQKSANPVWREFLYSAVGGLGTSGLAALGSVSGITNAIIAGSVAGATFLTKAGLDAKEQRVIREVLQLSLSDKAEDAARLGRLLSSNVSAVTGLRKYTGAVNNSIRSGFLAASRAKEQQENREKDVRWRQEGNFVTPDQIPGFNTGEAAGGRIQRKSGGRIGHNSISAEIVRTRSLLNQNTASMLSMPDDAIVTALTIAKHK